MCTEQLSVFHWIINFLYRGPQCLFYSKITDFEKYYIGWLDLAKYYIGWSDLEFSLWNTKNTDRNVVNE